MDNSIEKRRASKDIASGSAASRPSVYSGEWMTFPTMSAPADNDEGEGRIESVAANEFGGARSGINAIDVDSRNRQIDSMRAALLSVIQRPSGSSTSSAIAATVISADDANAFLALHRTCFPPDTNAGEVVEERPISKLKQEMMVQILEDFGDQLLGNQAVDPIHLEYLRTTVHQLGQGSSVR